MDSMSAFLTTDEEMKWDKDNICIDRLYTLFEIS